MDSFCYTLYTPYNEVRCRPHRRMVMNLFWAELFSEYWGLSHYVLRRGGGGGEVLDKLNWLDIVSNIASLKITCTWNLYLKGIFRLTIPTLPYNLPVVIIRRRTGNDSFIGRKNYLKGWLLCQRNWISFARSDDGMKRSLSKSAGFQFKVRVTEEEETASLNFCA